MLTKALKTIENVVSKVERIPCKKQAVANCRISNRDNQFYVNHRWLGGM